MAVVLFAAILVAALGGGNPAPTPAAPQTGPGSAQAKGKDVVPPPGDKFCPDDRTDCK